MQVGTCGSDGFESEGSLRSWELYSSIHDGGAPMTQLILKVATTSNMSTLWDWVWVGTNHNHIIPQGYMKNLNKFAVKIK